MSAHATPVQQHERLTLQCENCDLVQFPTASQTCRKCHQPYAAPPVSQTDPQSAPASGQESSIELKPHRNGQYDIAAAILVLRRVMGMNQQQLAKRMKAPRTYISKLECRRAVPYIATITRLADAFHCQPSDLIALSEICAQL